MSEAIQTDLVSLVFTNTVGGPINPSHLHCRSFKPLLERAGLPRTTFHAATRHTFCYLALQQGVNVKTISLAMGHSSVVKSRIFCNFLQGRQALSSSLYGNHLLALTLLVAELL
jgi:site-specific recombinase XerD